MSEHVRGGLSVGMAAGKCDGVCVTETAGLVRVGEHRRWRRERGRGGQAWPARLHQSPWSKGRADAEIASQLAGVNIPAFSCSMLS